MSEYFAMGRLLTIEDEKEKSARCYNYKCRTKLTQNEIEENGDLCNACQTVKGQERVGVRNFVAIDAVDLIMEELEIK